MQQIPPETSPVFLVFESSSKGVVFPIDIPTIIFEFYGFFTSSYQTKETEPEQTKSSFGLKYYGYDLTANARQNLSKEFDSYNIKYTDYNGVEREETFFFNLSKAELVEVQLTHPGGYVEYLQRIVEAKDQATIIKAFKELIDMTYGEKSEDGRKFIKSSEISKGFRETPAYESLFFELSTDENAAIEFVTKTFPPIEEGLDDADLLEKTRALIETKANQD